MKTSKNTLNLLLVGGGADAVDVRYACGFTAPDPFLFLQKGSEQHLLVSMLELGRASALEGQIHCHTTDSLGLKKEAGRFLGKQAVGLVRHLGLKQISVSPVCPVGLVRDLEKAGIKVRVTRPPLYPERLLKTDREIRCLRASQRAAVSAMKTAFAFIRESGVDARNRLRQSDGSLFTAESLRREIEKVLLEADCVAEDIIVAGGDQAVDPHERGHGPLYAGQWIVLDIFPRSKVTGYWGDITRTVMKGKPSPDQKRLYRTVLLAQREALSKVKAGVTGKEIHEGICARFKEAGYETGLKDGVPQGFIHSTGHGVGLEIHEAPSVSSLGGALEPGQVITIEPGLYYKGLGGVRIEDTVVVTEDGYSFLARCGKESVL